MGTATEPEWEKLARNMLRAELTRRGVSYARLVEALRVIGVAETEAAIKNKVSRGRFSLVFFLQAMVAIGAEWIQVPGAADLLPDKPVDPDSRPRPTTTKMNPTA